MINEGLLEQLHKIQSLIGGKSAGEISSDDLMVEVEERSEAVERRDSPVRACTLWGRQMATDTVTCNEPMV